LDNTNKYEAVLIKFDTSGETIWQKVCRDPYPLEDLLLQLLLEALMVDF